MSSFKAEVDYSCPTCGPSRAFCAATLLLGPLMFRCSSSHPPCKALQRKIIHVSHASQAQAQRHSGNLGCCLTVLWGITRRCVPATVSILRFGRSRSPTSSHCVRSVPRGLPAEHARERFWDQRLGIAASILHVCCFTLFSRLRSAPALSRSRTMLASPRDAAAMSGLAPSCDGGVHIHLSGSAPKVARP
eukprot:5589766-Prymnesium_polylepis.1